MTSTTSWAAAAAAAAEEQEWELVNDDDGFVYKRLKRPRLDPTISAPPVSDPEAEERTRRDRKKRILLNLKRRYQEEITQWEHLSNTLKVTQEKTLNQQQQQQPPDLTTVSDLPPVHSLESTCRQLVDDLHAQVEAQEAIIQDISNLCSVAEALCSAQEERMKQPFINLPIWESSPRELMASLCEE